MSGKICPLMSNVTPTHNHGCASPELRTNDCIEERCELWVSIKDPIVPGKIFSACAFAVIALNGAVK